MSVVTFQKRQINLLTNEVFLNLQVHMAPIWKEKLRMIVSNVRRSSSVEVQVFPHPVENATPGIIVWAVQKRPRLKRMEQRQMLHSHTKMINASLATFVPMVRMSQLLVLQGTSRAKGAFALQVTVRSVRQAVTVTQLACSQ